MLTSTTELDSSLADLNLEKNKKLKNSSSMSDFDAPILN